MSDDRALRRFDHLRLGAHGEDLAQRWYLERGYSLLARNWRCDAGELDLVLGAVDPGSDGGTLVVFCEVKTRSTARYGTPFEAVGRDKQRRIRRLAMLWLASQRRRPSRVRFDVVGVVGGRVEVIEDAF